ncbi:unnamed protein product [Oikopleura dioica]|uniref:RING-type domain-containing protein n=2 Tax=Oikopleura dioica TaxID=34765 RepID=E4XV62_OIKDI|nr:unnamed protein product [Oikopleura dioica]
MTYDWNAEDNPVASQQVSPNQTSGSDEPVFVSPAQSVASNMSQQSNEELKTEPAGRQQKASQKDEEQEPATPRASARRNSKNPDKDLKEEIRKLRLKVTELENKLEEFEEAKEEEHENLNQQVSDLTNKLDTVTNERDDLINQNNDLTERNEALDAEFELMTKSVEEKDDEIKRLRGQIRKGPVSVKDFNVLKQDFETLDAHNDEVQKELDTQVARKNYYKELIGQKDKEVEEYHKKMQEHNETQMPKKAYQDCLKMMENLKQENARMNEEVNVKWRQALMNSESRYQYFLHQNNSIKQHMERLRNDLEWKNSELESTKQRIAIQDAEIRRLARAEEDLHVNIKQAISEQEKIMHEKMQAEIHLQDHAAINKESENKLKELEQKRLEMEAKIKEGEKARNDLMTSRNRYQANVEKEKQEYKKKLEVLEEIEEGNILTCIICYDPYDDADHFAAALPCGHRFGNTCIKTSLQRNGNCPTCMKNFGVNDLIRLFVQ